MTEAQPTGRFAGKIALVTGGGRGIGKSIALRLASEGADVMINFFRKREPAEATVAELRALGVKAEAVRVDLGDGDGPQKLIEEVKQWAGGLDILVNNAASGYNHAIMDQRVKGWDWTLNINARAALFTAQQAAPLMQARGGGYIVNLSSIGANYVLPEYVVVGVSKAALEAVTRYLSVEFAPMNIVVNAVSAGAVATEALKHFNILSDKYDERLEMNRHLVPAGRNVEPEDVAGVVAFMCTPEAWMIRGQVILIDGGFTLTTY